MSELTEAQQQEREANLAISRERQRARVMAHPWYGSPVVITEDAVLVVDALLNSLDAGSGFLDEPTEAAMYRLGTLLRFDCLENYPTGETRDTGYGPFALTAKCGHYMGHLGDHGPKGEA